MEKKLNWKLILFHLGRCDSSLPLPFPHIFHYQNNKVIKLTLFVVVQKWQLNAWKLSKGKIQTKIQKSKINDLA